MATARQSLKGRIRQRFIENTAWDATVGAGNTSEAVDYELLQLELGRAPTEDEKEAYAAHWAKCLQAMAQP